MRSGAVYSHTRYTLGRAMGVAKPAVSRNASPSAPAPNGFIMELVLGKMRLGGASVMV